MRQGDDVEVMLENQDVEAGVTIHWHGVDVPNAEDGVAGVTQNAVLPGERYTYRFRAEQVGTFWYHTHQVSSKEVRRGLFGVLVIEPRTQRPGVDLAVVVHTFDGIPTLNRDDSSGRQRIAAGTPVRLRLVNTDSFGHSLTVSGTPFRVLAIDGTELNEPTDLANVSLPIAAGGRFDVGFVQPPRSVRLGIEGSDVVSRPEPASRTRPRRAIARGQVRPTGVRQPCTGAVRRDDRVRPALRADSLAQTGFFNGRPGTAVGDQRRDLS